MSPRFLSLWPRAQRFLFATLITAAWLRSTPPACAADAASPTPPVQGAALLKTDLMVVLAHPDDETMMAPLIARTALKEGKTVAIVYATRGEGGGNMVGTQAGPALGILREVELRDCLRGLGVRHVFFLDQNDFAYTESAGATLARWDHEKAVGGVVRLMRALRPEVILTIHPAPFPGQHGHHQTAGLIATEAFNAAADTRRFPAQLDAEGLSPWQPRKLYYSGSGPRSLSIPSDEPLPDGRTPGQVAGESLSNHRSQAFGNMANAPWLRRAQMVTRVKSIAFPKGAESERGLFDYLDRDLPPSPLIETVSLAETNSASAVRLEFIPRPAIQRFLDWTRVQKVDRAVATLKADLPVVVGDRSRLMLRLTNPTAEPLSGQVQIALPPHFGGAARASFSVAARGECQIPVDVQPPSNLEADVEIKSVLDLGSQKIEAVALLHPVPQARIPHVSQSPWQGGATASPGTSGTLLIPHTRTAQGKPDSAADCSATVQVAHDGKSLFVEVNVTDDVVVSNIEPNDIKGHWRSDSVELCIDPVGGAEDTFGSFKLGIFPFDTTGMVRAARDADARPGPVERTAPGVELASRKTPTGYRIRAVIPFGVAGIDRSKQPQIGFNVLVYDGDKKDAARGENINKSRIAWAPRSGVQGRPEDWGRLWLE